MKLHPIQQKLFELFANDSMESLSLRDIGEMIGVEHPQQVQHHINQLEKKGYIRREGNTGSYIAFQNPIKEIVYLPLYGMAQCGPNGFDVDESKVEKVPLPSKTLNIADPSELLLVKANGASMIPMINEGDLVLVRKQNDIDFENQIALVVHNEKPKIKKVVRCGEAYTLISTNSIFEPEIANSRDLQIVGVVKSIISNISQ